MDRHGMQERVVVPEQLNMGGLSVVYKVSKLINVTRMGLYSYQYGLHSSHSHPRTCVCAQLPRYEVVSQLQKRPNQVQCSDPVRTSLKVTRAERHPFRYNLQSTPWAKSIILSRLVSACQESFGGQSDCLRLQPSPLFVHFERLQLVGLV